MNDAEIKLQVSVSGNGAKKSLNAIGDTAVRVGKKITSVGKKLTASVTAPIIALGTYAVKSAMDFEDSFAQVKTLLDTTITDLDAYKESIIDASNETGIAVDEYSTAVYQAISAGIDQADAVAFVTNQVKLAKGGFTDLTTAVDTTTSILNAYGLTADDTTKINDILITTQNKGKTTVDELGASLSQVTPTAAAMGVKFEQVATSLAVMTAQGTPTAQATTQLNSMISELGKSGTTANKSLVDVAKSLGYTDEEANKISLKKLMKDGYGLSDILKTMKKSADKNGKSLMDMFGSLEAGKAALSITSDAEGFNEILAEMEDSAGSTDEAFETVSETTEEKFKRSLNELKNTAIELGNNLMPIVEKIANGISKLAAWFNSLNENQQKTILTVLGIVAAVGPLITLIGSLTTGIGMASKAMGFLASNPTILIFAAMAVAIGVIITQVLKLKKALNEAKVAADSLKSVETSVSSKRTETTTMVAEKGTDKQKSAYLEQLQTQLKSAVDELNRVKDEAAAKKKSNPLGYAFAKKTYESIIATNQSNVDNIRKNIRNLGGTPKYEKGTNYVPNDGLAYLHKGEAVVPKKYNYSGGSGLSIMLELPSIELDGNKLTQAQMPYITRTVKVAGGNI